MADGQSLYEQDVVRWSEEQAEKPAAVSLRRHGGWPPATGRDLASAAFPEVLGPRLPAGPCPAATGSQHSEHSS
jgi:hypothetical protein